MKVSKSDWKALRDYGRDPYLQDILLKDAKNRENLNHDVIIGETLCINGYTTRIVIKKCNTEWKNKIVILRQYTGYSSAWEQNGRYKTVQIPKKYKDFKTLLEKMIDDYAVYTIV